MTQAASHDFYQSKPEEIKSEPWKGICSSGCYAAKTDRKKCKCKCRGQHHGKGNTTKENETLTEFCKDGDDS
jgi:hypothetical protein